LTSSQAAPPPGPAGGLIQPGHREPAHRASAVPILAAAAALDSVVLTSA